ncbi:MAG: type II CAAX endopeptidase family protein [Erysipelotrichaceae bacterium]|nr:type II CAAX endopeptidase family protein [Erysipelotrichaceae bacterium]
MYQFERNRSPLKVFNVLAVMFTYFVGYLYLLPRLIVYVSDKILHTYEYVMYMQFGCFILITFIVVLLSKSIFIEANENRYDNRQNNFSYAIRSLVVMYGWMIFLNLIINFLTQQSSSINQMDIINLSMNYPVLTFIMAVVLAPIAEEVVFRGVIFRSLRNINYPIAIFTSSLLFGFVHVASAVFSGNYADMMYVIVYAMLGYYIGSNYERSGNIYIAIGMHATLNLVSMVLMFLARLAG